MNTQEMNDEEAFNLLKWIMAAQDDGFELWPRESVEFALGQWKKKNGNLPSSEGVFNLIGIERTRELVNDVIQWRTFDNALKGYRSPCHYCGSEDDLAHHDFALMCVQETKREWAETLATTALSALTLSLVGAGRVHLPSKSLEGAAYHLKLAVCSSCCKKEGNIFGVFIINEKRASKHPMWEALQEAGFTKFLVREKMPESFRIDFGQHL